MCRVGVEQLDQQRDAPAGPHHVAVGRGRGHGQERPGHLVDIGAAQEGHQGVDGLNTGVQVLPPPAS